MLCDAMRLTIYAWTVAVCLSAVAFECDPLDDAPLPLPFPLPLAAACLRRRRSTIAVATSMTPVWQSIEDKLKSERDREEAAQQRTRAALCMGLLHM
jgi:hypothetical protein